MSHKYVGTWRIIEMEQWDQDFIDLVVPGYIAFRKDNLGEFQFGAVHGDIDYRIESYQATERLEFAWEGEDEMDPVSGRGWAIIKDGQLQGRLYFHEGDESGFMAEKDAETEGTDAKMAHSIGYEVRGVFPCHRYLRAANQTMKTFGGKLTSLLVEYTRMYLHGLNDSEEVSM